MNRRYTIGQYLDILAYMRQKMPDITVTSDIIVGFPGETEDEFEETLDAIRAARCDQLFTFIYSPRKGTPAAEMEQLPDDVKGARMTRLLEVQNAIMLEKNQACIGREYDILVEGVSRGDKTMYAGRTEGGKLVHFPADEALSLTGQLVRVKITAAETYNLWAECI
jgi:tRNA-2-methylthio-N6-dimethylallyladenosine synthase